MKVFITGATGFIGRKLVAKLLERGDELLVVSRDEKKARKILGDKVTYVEADPMKKGSWQSQVDGCEAIINLAGESILGRRWSSEVKARLRKSRLEITTHLAEAVAASKNPPKVMVSSSAIGFYGTHPTTTFTETSKAGQDFLAQLCVDWENAARPVEKFGVRLVFIRTGLVLHPDGGALKSLLMPFKLGLGGPVASGEQWVSWIHLDDLLSFFLQALDNPMAQGAFDGTAPHPVPNRIFSENIASTLKRPCALRVPATVLKLALGEASELLTKGQRVIPARAKELGFEFEYPTIQSALNNLL